MATPYYLYTVKDLPPGAKYGTEDQLYLTINQRQNQENVHTTVELTDSAFRNGVARYECRHDFLTKLRYPGRALNVQFEQFVTPYEFPVYVLEASSKVSSRTLVVRTKGKVADDCVKRLNKKLDDFIVVEK